MYDIHLSDRHGDWPRRLQHALGLIDSEVLGPPQLGNVGGEALQPVNLLLVVASENASTQNN